jgi:hypothetical protein
MRKIILLISLFLLPATWAFAQYGGYGERPHDRDQGANKLRVEGCLYGEPGNLVLMDDQGNSFALTGRMTARLNPAIGHRVRVEGRTWFDPNNPNAMGANEENGPNLHVFEIEHIFPGECGYGEQPQGGDQMHFDVPLP